MSEKPDFRYITWLSEVRAQFDLVEEFDIAQGVYKFRVAYHAGISPRAAYEDFDKSVATVLS